MTTRKIKFLSVAVFAVAVAAATLLGYHPGVDMGVLGVAAAGAFCSTESNLISISRVSAADLTAKQFFGVKLDANGQIVLAGAGERAIGVLQNKPNVGEVGTVAIWGQTLASANGVINPNDPVKCDGGGEFVAAQVAYTKTDDGGAAQDPLVGSNVVGICAATAATADGDLFNLILTHSGAVPTTAA